MTNAEQTFIHGILYCKLRSSTLTHRTQRRSFSLVTAPPDTICIGSNTEGHHSIRNVTCGWNIRALDVQLCYLRSGLSAESIVDESCREEDAWNTVCTAVTQILPELQWKWWDKQRPRHGETIFLSSLQKHVGEWVSWMSEWVSR